MVYKSNIVRINPIGFFSSTLGMGDNPTPSMGISYERILDKEGQVSVNLPVYIGIKRSNKTHFNSWMDDARITNFSTFINPGIKIYPKGQQLKNYAVGPSFFAIYANDDSYFWSNGAGRRLDMQYVNAGLLLNNYWTLNITPKFNLGMELSTGLSFFNRRVSDGTSSDPGKTFVIALGFQAGYRF
ncbi:hypothetical protein D3C72_1580580 [compost metagenome]